MVEILSGGTTMYGINIFVINTTMDRTAQRWQPCGSALSYLNLKTDSSLL